MTFFSVDRQIIMVDQIWLVEFHHEKISYYGKTITLL